MFLDWKNQYFENGHTTQSNLQIQCNPYQITHDIFHRTRLNNPNIYMEPQKTQNRQSNPEKQKPSRRHNSPSLQEILQSHSHQNSVVLLSKQTDRPMEQNREPRNKPRHLQSINLWQRRQEYKMGKRQSIQQVLLGNLDSLMQSNETRTHPHTMHKNKLKMAERLKYKTRHRQTSGREYRQNILWHQPYKCCLRSVSQSNRNKSKNKPVGPNQTYKFLHSKGNHKKTKKKKKIQTVQLTRA